VSTADLHSLFNLHRTALLRFLTRRIGCPDTAADLAQESFLRLLRLGPALQMNDARAYLFTAAANLARDYLRHARISRTADNAEDVLAALPDPAPSAERQAIARGQLALAQALLAELPDRTRTAFEMHRLGGYSQNEIAAHLGVSVTLVWRMIHHAYRHLRAALPED
jgi:RNA polymerase sigma-70 factor (ECF subfamily)